MSDKDILVFIDESGNVILKSKGFYILVAVVINKKDFHDVLNILEERINPLAGNMLKSSNVGADHIRRLKILNAIFNDDVNFKYYALVVNKNNLYRDSGYKFNKSFYKNFHYKLYKLLNIDFEVSVDIFLDKFGTSEFMCDFQKYMEEKGPATLFSKYEFLDDQSSRFIQLADFIAGTLSYCFDKSKQNKYINDFRTILRKKEIIIEGYPPHSYCKRPLLSSNLDDILESISFEQLANFIGIYENSNDDKEKMCIDIIKYLEYKKSDVDEPATSDEIESHLKQYYTNVPDIKLELIPFIRDNGVLLAGNSQGYRIITTVEHLNDYISHTENVTIGMLKRLELAQKTIKIKTINQFDILEDSILKNILNTYIADRIR